MSEERAGQESGERDDLDELLDRDEDEAAPEEGEELDLGEGGEEGSEEQPEEPPRQTHDQRRRVRQRDELRELRETNRRLLEAVTRQPAQSQFPQQPDPARQAQLDREEAERVAQMPFEEQSRYWTRKTEERLQQQMLRGNLETRDMLDRIQFQQVMRERRLPARYATEVDNLLAQARQNGMNPTREWLLKTVIGGEVLERKERDTERQRIRGQRRIASQTTRPSGTRSTAASGGGRRNQDQAADDEALLRGVSLGDVWNSGA